MPRSPKLTALRRSAGPIPHRRVREKERVQTVAVLTMKAAATPRTLTKTIAAHPPASPVLRTMRVTQIPLPNSKWCRLPAVLPRPPPPPLQGQPSSQLQGPQQLVLHPHPLRFHHQYLSHLASLRLLFHLQPTPISSRPQLCIHKDFPPHTHLCNP